jgi:ribosomal protein S18 acetylase RimI-like enzyme
MSGVEHGRMWALDLPPPGPAPVSSRAARFGAIDQRAAAALAAAMEAPEAEVASRLARGSRALVLWVDDEVASYCWVSTGREDVGELGRSLVLMPGESYVWDCATVPRFRGHGLYTSLLRRIAETLASEGQRRVWIGASTANEASNRGFAAAGYRPVAAVVAVRAGGDGGSAIEFRGLPGADPELVAAARLMLGD